MTERSDSEAVMVSPDELEGVRAYIRMRDECAMRLGAAWFEFESLKRGLERRVDKLLADETAVVNDLARRYGLTGERFRINLDTGQIERVD